MQPDQTRRPPQPGNDTAGVPASFASRQPFGQRSRLRLLVHAVWVLLLLGNLLWFVQALVVQVTAIQHPCSDVSICIMLPAQAETLRQMGIGLGTFAAFYVGIAILIVLAGSCLAILLFWRRRDDPIALVVGLFLLSPVGVFANSPTSAFAQPLVVLPLAFASGIIYYLIFLIFPDGRFVPRWAWLLLAAWVALDVLQTAAVQMRFFSQTPLVLDVVGATYPLLFLSLLAAQIYRFGWVSTPRQRQQTKWVILGIAIALLANITYWFVLPLVVPAWNWASGDGSLYDLVAFPLWQLASLALPVSFAVAIQRDQLFDVDVLINRTLVYGTLTAILAAVYFGVIVAAQAAVGTVNRQASGSPVIVVATTLFIAALFTPLRRGLQALIDRRFYRSTYDAAQTMEAFAATLRTNLDLAELSAHLIEVVQDTMHPESVQLWLRDAPTVPREVRSPQSGAGER